MEQIECGVAFCSSRRRIVGRWKVDEKRPPLPTERWTDDLVLHNNTMCRPVRVIVHVMDSWFRMQTNVGGENEQVTRTACEHDEGNHRDCTQPGGNPLLGGFSLRGAIPCRA